MTVKFLNGSYAEDMLKMVALCGEFPWSGLDMIERDKKILLRSLLKIRKDGFMSVSGSAEMKTIRMTKKGLAPLLELGEGYLAHYLGMTEGHKFRGGTKASGAAGATQTWRRHRMAEILVTFLYSGVKVWDFEKPYIDLSLNTPKLINEDDIVFYTSRQLKNAGDGENKKVDFTRIMGALFSPGGIYPIYHTNKGLMKWQQQGEMKAQILLENIVNCNYNSENHFDYHASRAIMFGKDINVFVDILKSNGGKRMQNNFELLSFDNTYNNIHFITLDDNGNDQLKMLMSKNWKEKMLNIIFPEEIRISDTSDIDADARIENTFVLSFLDGDIGRLKRFTKSSIIAPDYEFQVICFPWQEEALKKYSSNIKTNTINHKAFFDAFFERG